MFVSGYVHRLLRYEARHARVPWTALMVLKDLDLLGPLSQKALAEIEQVRAPTIAVLIGQMERQGWVKRIANPSDGRSQKVSITSKGRKKLASAGRVLHARLEAELGALALQDFHTLAAGLRELSAAIAKKIGLSPGN
jgi:DNA-binding MarR family transcriptional regulator